MAGASSARTHHLCRICFKHAKSKFGCTKTLKGDLWWECINTGKSLSEALICASINPQYDILSYCGLVDERISASEIDLPVLDIKATSASNHSLFKWWMALSYLKLSLLDQCTIWSQDLKFEKFDF